MKPEPVKIPAPSDYVVSLETELTYGVFAGFAAKNREPNYHVPKPSYHAHTPTYLGKQSYHPPKPSYHTPKASIHDQV